MIMYCFTLLERLKADRRGITALEYAVLGSIVVAVIGVAATTLGGRLGTVFGTIGSDL
jgi:Flp pilus assembly pilin Flp